MIIMKIKVLESEEAMPVSWGKVSILCSNDTAYVVVDDKEDGVVIPQ